MKTQIRYTIIEDSYWYSLEDIVAYLYEKGAISNKNTLLFNFRKNLASEVSKGKCQFSFNCTISIKTFDEFINWVKISSFLNACKKSEKDKIYKTGIITAIDSNNHEWIKRTAPDIYERLIECIFSEKNK